MQQQIYIQGMTCKSCEASVEEKLSNLIGVESVNVSLEDHTAIIRSDKHYTIDEIQAVLPDKYTVFSGKQPKSEMLEAAEQSLWKQLTPLYIIFLYITMASVLLNISPWQTDAFMLDFMGLFYVVFSFFKFLDYKGFPNSFAMYDPLAKQVSFYGWIYPFIELGLGLFFLFRFQIQLALIATLVILGITTFGVVKALLDKKTIQCACLGTALKLPMTKATFIENSIMIIMALWMLTS